MDLIHWSVCVSILRLLRDKGYEQYRSVQFNFDGSYERVLIRIETREGRLALRTVTLGMMQRAVNDADLRVYIANELAQELA